MEKTTVTVPEELKIHLELPPQLYEKDDVHTVSVGSVMGTLSANAKFIIRFCMVFFVLSVAAAIAYFVYVPTYMGTVSALVSYGYAEAETGLDPMGNPLDTNVIRSPYIIDKAIKALELYSKGITAEDVRSNMSIEGVLPDDVLERILIIKQIATDEPSKLEELPQVSYHPTQYIITLRQGGILKDALTQQDAVNLVNEICNQYEQYFIEEYSTNDMLDTIIRTFDQNDYDYFEIVQILRGQVNNMINYCDMMSFKASDFRSPTTAMTFADINASINLIKSVDISRIEALINANAMTRNKNRSINIYEYDIAQKQAELNKILANSENAERLAGNFEKDYWVMYNNEEDYDVFRQASEVYDQFMRSAMNNGETAHQLSEEIALYNEFLTSLRTNVALPSPTDVKFVEEAIPSLVETLQGWVVTINETTDDYVKLDLFKDSVKVVTPAKFYSVVSTYTRNMVLIVGAGVGVGLFLAVFIALGRDAVNPPKPKRGRTGTSAPSVHKYDENDILA